MSLSFFLVSLCCYILSLLTLVPLTDKGYCSSSLHITPP
uniref:Uncharacterized protein n=1 Tax=Arundo donax TaxID=35708 RepID=A0A0A8ZM22_ARUDO